jgi:hypothetical protein
MLLELLARQPVHMRFGPRLLARVVPSEPQQKRRHLLALRPQILNRSLPCPGQIAHRLVTLVRNPDRSELARTQLSGQVKRITAVGLHPITRLLRGQ